MVPLPPLIQLALVFNGWGHFLVQPHKCPSLVHTRGDSGPCGGAINMSWLANSVLLALCLLVLLLGLAILQSRFRYDKNNKLNAMMWR